MLSVLLRRISKVGVSAIGLALILWGLGSMWTGWDQIVIERGWSLFIAGATLVAGGAVTLSAGLILARLDALTRAIDVGAVATVGSRQQIKPQLRSKANQGAAQPQTKAKAEGQRLAAEPGDAPTFLADRMMGTPQPHVGKLEPVVIDRYESGGTMFTMYSDGSVEVRSDAGVKFYASVAELRARMES